VAGPPSLLAEAMGAKNCFGLYYINGDKIGKQTVNCEKMISALPGFGIK
jgi:hypothetical protein